MFVAYYYLTAFDILKTTLNCISKQNVMKIYHEAQELSAFSLTGLFILLHTSV